MNEDYKQKILNWLEQKWPKDRRCCPTCGDNKWTLSPELVTPSGFKNGNIDLGTSCPQFLVVCNNCGTVKYFSAVFAKLLNNEGGVDGHK